VTGQRGGQKPCPDALAHQTARKGGHWWDEHGDQPPEWYVESAHANTVADDVPQRCEAVSTPDVPESVPWTEYRFYACAGCGWPCIEHQDSDASKSDRCWYCLQPDAPLPDGRKVVKKPQRAAKTGD
jgi:hypothetical protein